MLQSDSYEDKMPANVVTRREFLANKMTKEFPGSSYAQIQRAIVELEYEYPETNFDELVFMDTGKVVGRANKKVAKK